MHNTPIMSLDNFFAHPGSMKKKDGRKKGGRGNANANATHASHDHNIIKPVNEVSGKLDSVIERNSGTASLGPGGCVGCHGVPSGGSGGPAKEGTGSPGEF